MKIALSQQSQHIGPSLQTAGDDDLPDGPEQLVIISPDAERLRGESRERGGGGPEPGRCRAGVDGSLAPSRQVFVLNADGRVTRWDSNGGGPVRGGGVDHGDDVSCRGVEVRTD